MLSERDIEMFTVPKSNKIDALFDVLHKIEDADDILRDAIYGFMPMLRDDERQDEADKIFWHSEGMSEINEVSFAIRTIRELVQRAIHALEDSPITQIAC